MISGAKVVGDRQTEFIGQRHPATTHPNPYGVEQSVHHLEVAGHRCSSDHGGFAGCVPEGGSGAGHLVSITKNGGIREGRQLESRRQEGIGHRIDNGPEIVAAIGSLSARTEHLAMGQESEKAFVEQ